ITSASAKAAPERKNMSTQENKDEEIIGEHLGKQAPPISTALVVQSSEEEPLIKKVKLSMLEFIILSPTPLNSIMPYGIRPPVIINNIPFDQCIANLFSLSSSEFFLTPPQ
ncbi:hypothetical protein Tco_0258604, partial [Tanacetum coccineum]